MKQFNHRVTVSSPAEYPRRLLAALRGFRHLGLPWLAPCLAYLLHPVLRRFLAGRTCRRSGFRARIGTDDLFVLGQIFREYDPGDLRDGLARCDLVVDAGANVRAFSWLAQRLRPGVAVVAVEPERANFTALAGQPFAPRVRCVAAALDTSDAGTFLLPSAHSAAHRTSRTAAHGIGTPTVTLDALVGASRWTLLELDIEGAEKAILEHGVPRAVEMIVMEWHYPGPPTELDGGRWIHRGESACTWRRAA